MSFSPQLTPLVVPDYWPAALPLGNPSTNSSSSVPSTAPSSKPSTAPSTTPSSPRTPPHRINIFASESARSCSIALQGSDKHQILRKYVSRQATQQQLDPNTYFAQEIAPSSIESPENFRVFSYEDDIAQIAAEKEMAQATDLRFRILTDCFASRCGFAEEVEDKRAYSAVNIARGVEVTGKTRRKAVFSQRYSLKGNGFSYEDLEFLAPEDRVGINNAAHVVNCLPMALSMRALRQQLGRDGYHADAIALERCFEYLLGIGIDAVISSKKVDVEFSSKGIKPAQSLSQKYGRRKNLSGFHDVGGAMGASKKDSNLDGERSVSSKGVHKSGGTGERIVTSERFVSSKGVHKSGGTGEGIVTSEKVLGSEIGSGSKKRSIEEDETAVVYNFSKKPRRRKGNAENMYGLVSGEG